MSSLNCEAYQAESFTLVYYVLGSVTKPKANGFGIVEIHHTIGVFGQTLRIVRRQVAWHRNFYVAQDTVKVLNKKTAKRRIVWGCSAAKGLDL